jgi:Ca2+/Na+ antiporter
MSIFIDVSLLPATFGGFVQVCTLGCVYGYGLFYAANLISDGSELLLLVPSWAGLVGSVVLPVLGAVPDGMMVIFSGMGSNAQEEVSVGVGALCGSTVMLLTVPWFLSIVAGRVNIDPNDGVTCIYKGKNKVSKDSITEYELWKTSGVKLSPEVVKAGHIMLLSTVPYALIQIPALFSFGAPMDDQARKLRPWAFLAALACFTGFGLYLYHCWKQDTDPKEDDASSSSASHREIQREEYIIKAISAGKISLVGVMQAEFEHSQSPTPSSLGSSAGTGAIPPQPSDQTIRRLRRVIDPFFSKYDTDGSGFLDIEELGRVFADMGENVSHKALMGLFKGMDTDNDGTISSDEFFNGVLQYIANHSHLLKKPTNTNAPGSPLPKGVAAGFQRIADSERGGSRGAGALNDDEEDEEEEEEAMPEDLVDLPAYEQQRRVKIRAAFLMLVGTGIVLLLSDPMVDVLAEVGKRIGVSPFYVSFIVAPIASNASEVLARSVLPSLRLLFLSILYFARSLLSPLLLAICA